MLWWGRRDDWGGVSGGAVDVGGGVFWGGDRGDGVGGDEVAAQTGEGVEGVVVGVVGGLGCR